MTTWPVGPTIPGTTGLNVTARMPADANCDVSQSLLGSSEGKLPCYWQKATGLGADEELVLVADVQRRDAVGDHGQRARLRDATDKH